MELLKTVEKTEEKVDAFDRVRSFLREDVRVDSDLYAQVRRIRTEAQELCGRLESFLGRHPEFAGRVDMSPYMRHLRKATRKVTALA